MLTNGRMWRLLFQSEKLPGGGSQFCEVDLTAAPDVAVGELNRYLSRDRIARGQAQRSAERTLRYQTREMVSRQAVLDGWRRVVLGPGAGLLELVATAAEQRTGFRPETSLVRQVLRENRADLLPPAPDRGDLTGTGGGVPRSSPTSFTLLSETRRVSSWTDMLVEVCLAMYRRHSEDFERILEISGRKLPYFSRSKEDVFMPKAVGDTGIYASCYGTGALLERRSRHVVELFGYSAESLVVLIS